jgi:hypothetical protein
MKKVGRNDPCPCGSGKKYKKCHLGREDELIVEKIETSQKEVGDKIASLPDVHYGRSKEIIEGIDIQSLTGNAMQIRLVDLAEYLTLSGLEERVSDASSSASQIINLNKTKKSDPDNIYIAITPSINDSTLIHQIAHVLAHLKDSIPLPGAHFKMSEETQIPVEQFDHTKEFADWLEFLREKFSVQLDAEDKIVSFLNEKEVLLTREEVKGKERKVLIARSAAIFDCLKEHQGEIDALIRDRDGYVGSSRED